MKTWIGAPKYCYKTGDCQFSATTSGPALRLLRIGMTQPTQEYVGSKIHLYVETNNLTTKQHCKIKKFMIKRIMNCTDHGSTQILFQQATVDVKIFLYTFSFKLLYYFKRFIIDIH